MHEGEASERARDHHEVAEAADDAILPPFDDRWAEYWARVQPLIDGLQSDEARAAIPAEELDAILARLRSGDLGETP